MKLQTFPLCQILTFMPTKSVYSNIQFQQIKATGIHCYFPRCADRSRLSAGPRRRLRCVRSGPWGWGCSGVGPEAAGRSVHLTAAALAWWEPPASESRRVAGGSSVSAVTYHQDINELDFLKCKGIDYRVVASIDHWMGNLVFLFRRCLADGRLVCKSHTLESSWGQFRFCNSIPIKAIPL